MGNLENIAISVAALIPFLGVYFFGVALQRCHERERKKPLAPFFSVQALGEAMPAAFETIGALAVIFGALEKSSTPDTAFQSLGIIASASYLAFRGGYAYRSSFVEIVSGRRSSPRAAPGKA